MIEEKREDQMKRILFIHHGRGIGGAPTSMSYLAKEMNKDNFDVRVLFLYNSDAVKLFEGLTCSIVGLPLFYFNHTSHWVRIYRIHMILLQLISWFLTVFIVAPYWYLKIRPDVVYLNSSVLTDWSFVARMFKIKNLVHVREAVSKGHFGIRNWIIKKILDFSADCIIYLSHHNYSRLNTKRNKSFIVPNYVRDLPLDFIISEKKYDYVYVGGEKEIKGIGIIEKLITGDKKNKSILLLGYYKEDFIEKYSNIEKVHIIGIVPDAIKYIAASKFLLFPATTPHFPRPVIEAYSVGTIPVASDLEGIEEIIQDKKTGFIFKNENLDSLMVVLESANVFDNKSIIASGHQLFKEKFSIANEKRIMKMLISLLDK